MMISRSAKIASASRLPWSALPKVLRDHKAGPVRFPLPLYHTTLVMPVKGQPQCWTARVLLLEKSGGKVEPLAPLVHYMVENDFRSATWQNSLARGVGLFWDYCQVHARSGPDTPGFDGDLFERFILALVRGTIREGIDESELYWAKTSAAQTKLVASRVQKFFAWCERKGCSDLVLGRFTFLEAQGADHRKTGVWSRLQAVGTLAHLYRATPLPRRPGVRGLEESGVRVQPAKAFPQDRVEDLLRIGHRRPAAPQGGERHEIHNIRDQMMAILDGWGGLRRSEGLHLWVDDVTKDERTGRATVMLGHPVESRKPYWQNGRTVMLTRADILNRRYNLQPRNQVMRGRYHVGWKGMDLNSDWEDIVYWRDHDKGVAFYDLYKLYLTRIRDPLMKIRRDDNGGYDHPFLFVSEVDSESGQGGIGAPYSAQAYERNHARAVGRLGLEHRKDLGTTTHGLRHLYGRDLMRRELPPQHIQQALHHRSAMAQVPYTALDWSEVSDVIAKGWATVIDKARIPVRHGSPGSQRLGELADEARGGPRRG